MYYVFGKRNNIPSSLIGFLMKLRNKSQIISLLNGRNLFSLFFFNFKSSSFLKGRDTANHKKQQEGGKETKRHFTWEKTAHAHLISTDQCSLPFSHCFQWFCAQVQCWKMQESTGIIWAPSSLASSYTHNFYEFSSQLLIKWRISTFYPRNVYFHAL